MKNYRISSVQPENFPMCLDTIHKAFRLNCDKFGFTKDNYPSCAAFMTLEDLKKAKDCGTHIYAVWVDGRIAGCVQLKRADNDVYLLKRFAVLPEYQNLGFGKALISFCKMKALEYGGKTIRLLMVYENIQLRKFYSSCGFSLKKICTDNEHPFVCGIYEMNISNE